MKKILLSGAAFALLLTSSAWAAPQFTVDPEVDMTELAGSGRTALKSSRSGNLYQIDASIVLPVAAERYLEATLDFDHYVDMGMDHLSEAHCIGGSCQANPLIFWMHLSALGVSSKSYSELRVFRAIDNKPDSMGATWHQIRGDWGYPDAPLVSGMEGSLFLLPLDGPNGKKTYIRYVAGATIRTVLPNFVIERFVRHELGVNISDSIHKLADRAIQNKP